MSKQYNRMEQPYSKDWCTGFCRSCGVACGDYCEQIHKLHMRLTEALLENSSLKRSNRDLLESLRAEKEDEL